MKKNVPKDLSDEAFDALLHRLPRPAIAMPSEATVHRYLQGALSPAEAAQVRAAAAASEVFRRQLLTALRTVQEAFKKKLNLPEETRPFVGRAEELEKLQELVRNNRLVTVVGGGGLGKSRLARQCARVLAGELNVFYVDASRITCEEDFWMALDGADLAGTLLLLDDLKEPHAIAKLLEDNPSLNILATNRHPLKTKNEKVFDLDPMQADALTLFIAAAKRVLHDFQVNAQNRASVLNICKRLGGVPLSLTLAAGCLATQSVPELLKSLEPPRETATKADARPFLRALNHSILLLAESDRQTLRALAAFDGTFTAEDASFLLGKDAKSVLETLERKGLIESQDQSFRIHDEVATHLAATPQALERHATLFAERAERVGELIRDGRWAQGARELFANNANFRRAAQTAIAKNDQAQIAQLTNGLSRSYLEAGCLADFRLLVEAASKIPDSALQISLLGMQGALAAREGDRLGAARFWERRAEICRASGDIFNLADSLTDLALQAFDHDDFALAIGYLDEAQALSERAGSWELVATAQIIRARLHARLGQTAKALRWIEETRASMAKGENRDLLLFVHQSIAIAYQLLEMPEEARAAILKLLSEASEGHRAVLTGWSLRHLAPLYEAEGNLEKATKAHVAAIAVHGEYATQHRQRAVNAFQEFQQRHQGELPNLGNPPWQDLVQDLLTDKDLP